MNFYAALVDSSIKKSLSESDVLIKMIL